MRILALDLGTNINGAAILEVAPRSLELSSLKAFSFQTHPEIYQHDSEQSINYQLSDKVNYVCNEVSRLCSVYNPDVLVLEQPFFNAGFPLPAIRLYQLYHALLKEVRQRFPHISLNSITAPKARSYIGYKRMSDLKTKDAVKLALYAFPYLSQHLSVLDALDEHGLDATCVGVAYIVHFKTINSWQKIDEPICR